MDSSRLDRLRETLYRIEVKLDALFAVIAKFFMVVMAVYVFLLLAVLALSVVGFFTYALGAWIIGF